MIKNFFIFLLLFAGLNGLNAQITGKSTFAFMNLPNSARTTALGGSTLASLEKDISSSYVNPAALTKDHDKWLSLNYNNHLEGIQYGYAGFAKEFEKMGTWSAGLFYVDYGSIDSYDERENFLGKETAGEYCFQITHSKELSEKFRVGASLKYVYSVIGSYVGNGAALDIGGTYTNKKKKLSTSLVVRNAGVQIVKYTDEGPRESLPFGVHVGLTKELEHMPFRFHILYHDLQQWDLTYNNSNSSNVEIDLETGEPIQEKSTLGDKFLRHLNLGGEFILGAKRNFNLSFGYNHQKRKEISPEIRRGMTGFSWGIGFKINKFQVGYASTSYFPGFNTNQFSINLNLNDFKKGKKSKK